MEKIESQSCSNFKQYLDDTQNTICGRQPILLLLAIIEAAEATGKVTLQTKFVRYD
jgi:predicted class III extradiol MEMO1 family dioxygenase